MKARSVFSRGWIIAAVLGLSLIFVGTVQAVLNWMPYEKTNVSQSATVSHVALAVGAGKKAISWRVHVQSGEQRGDLILAQSSGSVWTTQTVTTTLESYWSSLAYSDTALLLAWSQGERYSDTTRGWVWEQDGEGNVRRVSETVFYHIEWVRPRLRVGSDGLHLAFAADPTATLAARGDLYYFYRPFTSTEWASTVVVTRDQVAEGGVGGVFYPDLAVGTDRLYLVWEQVSQPPGQVSYTVYFISATLDANPSTWGHPISISLSGEQGLRPAIALDGMGRVHIVWTKYISDAEQYVLYRRFDPSSGWSEPRDIGGGKLQVNQIRPTVIWPTIAARGEEVCVAWHGFYPDAPNEAEEIFLRCSQNGGQDWGTIMNVSQTPDKLSLMPAIAIGNDGAVHIAWEEFQGDLYLYNYDALYAAGPPEVHVAFLPLVLRNR